ncbi:PD-(D/E)XK nuclease family protein [Pseudarthrobacter sp. BIM B-2242]|uniref:RecB family exonuclease n=1 Tax=Pseudarthrobacter sp. BIM B-2242 TaxID=2772401 RepID=UPI00168A53CF|nr:PD-(D/E)XK nuclease family protein [Pseudarthrobacter sp. BIM B-2242]QOD05916.1 PD-(D/E)XK nuclease family protein [Pseudarthrobacter sp. BIM B-2242]
MTNHTPLLHDKLAWDGKTLVVTGENLVEKKLRRKALSASTSKSMQSCAARWVGERLLRSEEENPFDPAPLGTSAHAVLEDLFDIDQYDPSMRTLETAAAIVERNADTLWADNPDAPDNVRAETLINRYRWKQEVRTAYEGLWTIEDPSSINVWGRELQIDGLTINTVPSNGFIDRVREGVADYGRFKGQEGLIAEDYKSGKVPSTYNLRFGDDHGDQLRVYAAALEAKTGEKAVGAYVLYTKFGEKREVDLSEKAMAKTLKTFKLSWDRHNKYMKNASFPTKVSALCGWCPLVNACPVAKAEGKEAKIEGLLSATDLGIPSLRPGAAAAPSVPLPDSQIDEDDNLVLFAPDLSKISDEDLAAAEREGNRAAHMYARGMTPKTESSEDEMTFTEEPKPWVETVNGELNPNSYASTAAFGTASLALDELTKAGIEPKGSLVNALNFTFLSIVAEAQYHWTGSRSTQDGANTRLRGVFRSVLQSLPLPFGEDEAAWDAWAEAALRRTKALTSVALKGYGEEAPERPWAALAGVAPAEAVKAPAKRAPRGAKAEPAKEEAPAPAEAPAKEEAPAEEVATVTPIKAEKNADSAGAEEAWLFPDDDESAA